MDVRWKHKEHPVSQCQFLYRWREEVQESADAAPTWMSPPGPFPACTEHRKPPCVCAQLQEQQREVREGIQSRTDPSDPGADAAHNAVLYPCARAWAG